MELADEDVLAVLRTLEYDGKVECGRGQGEDDEDVYREARLHLHPRPDITLFPCGVCPVRRTAPAWQPPAAAKEACSVSTTWASPQTCPLLTDAPKRLCWRFPPLRACLLLAHAPMRPSQSSWRYQSCTPSSEGDSLDDLECAGRYGAESAAPLSQVISECCDDGPISPATCVYWQRYMEF